MTDRWQAGIDAIVEGRKHYTNRHREYFARIQAEALAFLKPYGAVLDVGCGDGGMRHALGDKVTSYVGIDPAPPEGADVERGKAEDLGFIGQRFDMALCYSVLQHVEEPDAALREMHRVLKPGGRLAMLVALGDRSPIFLWQFTAEDVLALVEQAGFAVEAFTVLDNRHLCVRATKPTN